MGRQIITTLKSSSRRFIGFPLKKSASKCDGNIAKSRAEGVFMCQFPSNSLEFKKGYRLGLEKGRSVERKIALALMFGFVLIFEFVHLFVFRFCKS